MKSWIGLVVAMVVTFAGAAVVGGCLGAPVDQEESSGAGLSAARDDGELVEMEGEAGECSEDAEADGAGVVNCACQCQTPAGNFNFTTKICDPPGCKAINGTGIGCFVYNRRTLALISTGTVGGCQ